MNIKIKIFVITVVVILFIFADTEGIKFSLGRIGSRGRVSGGRSTFWQTGSSSRKVGWNLPLSSYYNKESISRTSYANPTSLSEFAFRSSGINMQSRYPSVPNSPSYSPSGEYSQQLARDSYRGTGLVYPRPFNINSSYPNYDGHSLYDHVI
ncbi:uncharacterized protein LOC105199670 isoform X1 [Solenopsis invicta]|uniref:uncharacterized protein LOC105199670 isoform X1 n=1 Tax=Solenopsis invicta TaxID=13686 RepID=UPI00193D154D|nr:uncharacterized protein LOC105199670 isoform X1 [Solenopsis invicta]